MQFDDPLVEVAWRRNFHARQLSTDTLLASSGLCYSGATITKVVMNMEAGSSSWRNMMIMLAMAHFMVMSMIIGALLFRVWYARFRHVIVWPVPVILGCTSTYVASVAYTGIPLGPGSHPWWQFLKFWCIRGKWAILGLLAYGVRQPLDYHMTSNFPGILAALGFNRDACSDVAGVPEFKKCFHVLYRIWLFLLNPSPMELRQMLVPHKESSEAPFSEAQATAVCQGFFAASQVVLAFVWPCVAVARWELRDRALFLASPELRQRGLIIRWNRMYDVVAIMLLEIALAIILFDLDELLLWR